MTTRSLEKALERLDSVVSDIIPDTDSTRDLGSATKAFILAYLDAIEPVGVDTTIKRVGGTNTTPIVEGVAKAWSRVNYSGGTPVVGDSFNISSISDESVGIVGNNYTNSMSSINYSASVTSLVGSRVASISNGTQLAGSAQTVTHQSNTGAEQDVDRNMSCVGDLA